MDDKLLEVSLVTAGCEHIGIIPTEDVHDFAGDIHVLIEMVVDHYQLGT